MCSKLEVGTGPQASEILDYASTWLGLWNHPALVELDLSHHAMEALPEALASLTTLRVLRADSMRQLRDTTVLALPRTVNGTGHPTAVDGADPGETEVQL